MAAPQRRPLVAGNWKMNGLRASAAELRAMIAGAAALAGQADLMICPPATLVAGFAGALPQAQRSRSAGRIATPRPLGAFTGDISAEMLTDAGASAVIVGHSERRTLPSRDRRRWCGPRRKAAWRAGLTGDRLRRRDPRGARRRPDPRCARPTQLDGSLPGRRDRGQSGGRLRAGLGDRHRADADRGRRRARSHALHPQTGCKRATAGRRRGRPHPLWRLGQAVERQGTDGGRQRGRRPGRRRQPEGRRISSRSQRLIR